MCDLLTKLNKFTKWQLFSHKMFLLGEKSCHWDNKQQSQAQSDRCKILTDDVPISFIHPSIWNLVKQKWCKFRGHWLHSTYSTDFIKSKVDDKVQHINFRSLILISKDRIFGTSTIKCKFLCAFDSNFAAKNTFYTKIRASFSHGN